MGVLKIEAYGSFPYTSKTFSAQEHGHAHAVAEAIAFLTNDVLPWAISRDHQLQAEGAQPSRGFSK